MRQVLLDSSFILACVKQKIDFFHDIELMGLQILIPIQVISELRGILRSEKKLHEIDNAKLTLKVIEENSFEKINLENANVDQGIKEFADKNKALTVATLDKELKGRIKNPKMVIRRKKKLEII